ncbi:hypothetical protein Ocin01_19438 [Orchesella cincta]|uniref:Uncharacterized protein n=1 Tax=Orchesella cincta TaxID=48709 RepID=A0A1D2M2S4_ORCCI|nr:hypothetical protein Ocin01_19438 [Orchesella cincta]
MMSKGGIVCIIKRDDDSASSTDDEAILINELASVYNKFRDVPGKNKARGMEEYLDTKNEIVAHKVGETAYKYAVSITKSILCIVISILLSFVFKFDWIPGALVVFIIILTGLRFGWLQWHGEEDAVMKFG